MRIITITIGAIAWIAFWYLAAVFGYLWLRRWI